MHRMTVELISLRPIGTQAVARARTTTDDRIARLWIEITFYADGEPWADAYDRILGFLAQTAVWRETSVTNSEKVYYFP